ncbi:MAG TPA: RsmE family RNA methyltransferase [Phycisphaerae bacterium]|nr:RsmE family RNA methyltransferase [Phycisphaerae bacterium]
MTGPDRHRFFADSIAEDVVALPAEEAHHALHVLRLTDGTALEVFDGMGGVGEGVLRVPDRRGASVEIRLRRSARPVAAPVVELGFAVPKGKRLDWLLEKATELGAGVLAPVVFARSVARPDLSGKARARWRAHCIAAAKQCRADLLPEIRPPEELTDFLARPLAGVFGDPAAGHSLATALAELAGAQRVRILVGPEGGMTDPERAAAEAAGLTPVRLGGYVLRTETAAVAMLAAVRAGG